MKDKFGIFYKHFIYKNTLRGFHEFQGHKVNKGHISDFLQAFFCKNYQINFIISGIFGWLFLHFKDLLNEEQILNFYKHFICKNLVMNSK